MYWGKKRRHDDEERDQYIEELLVKEHGYGASLFKDSEDEKHINSLKDLERERILSERHQKVQNSIEKIKMLREYQKGVLSQNDALTDIRDKRENKIDTK